jgi:hypothetical protein
MLHHSACWPSGGWMPLSLMFAITGKCPDAATSVKA